MNPVNLAGQVLDICPNDIPFYTAGAFFHFENPLRVSTEITQVIAQNFPEKSPS